MTMLDNDEDFETLITNFEIEGQLFLLFNENCAESEEKIMHLVLNAYEILLGNYAQVIPRFEQMGGVERLE